MLKLVPLNERNLPLAEKTLRRLEASYSSDGIDFKAPEISKNVQEGNAYLAIDQGRALSIAIITHDLLSNLFPSSKSLEKRDHLYEMSGFKSEEILLLSVYFDPGFSNKQSVNSIFGYAESLFPRCSWGYIYKTNDPAPLPYLEQRGFVFIAKLDEVEDAYFYAKPYRKDGLASWDF